MLRESLILGLLEGEQGTLVLSVCGFKAAADVVYLARFGKSLGSLAIEVTVQTGLVLL
jgi:hypothetical protein